MIKGLKDYLDGKEKNTYTKSGNQAKPDTEVLVVRDSDVQMGQSLFVLK
ncbi:MAG: hypothetical protein KAR21_18215 [Spirochaetales bacterium]|nr:hypothetical protein [Spirochaetales bacterium]